MDVAYADINDRRTFACYSAELDLLAKKLFKQDGFVIIKNFISDIELEELGAPNVSMFDTCGGWGSFMTTGRISIEEDKYGEYAKKICELRVKIGMQPHADIFLFNFARTNNIDHIEDKNLKSLTDQVIENTWYRLTNYKNGKEMGPHLDGPGEMQALLFLTEKGKDYEQGGLCVASIEENADIICIDDLVKAGDLVFLNGNEMIHWVDKIKCSEEQAGRITLFVPGNPKFG